MSDTSQLLVDCQRWYGEENGLRIYNRHRDVLHRIMTHPTAILLPGQKEECPPFVEFH